MNKKIFILLTCITLFVCSSTAFADSLVTGGSCVTVGTRELGKVTIYIPTSYNEEWAFIKGLPVSTTSSYITGYILNSNGTGKYTVRIYNYSNGWEYRVYGSSTSAYTKLTVDAYFPKESNIFVKKYKGSTQNYILYALVLFGGISIIGIFFRKN